MSRLLEENVVEHELLLVECCAALGELDATIALATAAEALDLRRPTLVDGSVILIKVPLPTQPRPMHTPPPTAPPSAP